MASLFVAACFFVGIHLFVSGTGLRDRLVARLGERVYLVLFSIASGIGLIWLIRAWLRATRGTVVAPPETLQLWLLPVSWRPILAVVVGIAFLFVVVGLTTPSPTAAGGEGRLASPDPATGILRITRHPFLIGVGIWAVVHLIANGDTASLVFFGAFLILAVTGPVSIDRKRARKHGESWTSFARMTSIVPFAAIASGRNRLVLSEVGLWRPLAAIAIFACILAFHARIFGVAAL
jgi:uncharacterized membrane protein